MICADVQERFRLFFEDMLTEQEYQAVCAHMAYCHACRQYASSTGSLSYLLHELGTVPIPKDLGETIRFRTEKRREDNIRVPARPPGITGQPGLRSRLFLWGTVAVIFVSALFFFINRQKNMTNGTVDPVDEQTAGESDNEPAGYSFAIVKQKPVSHEEAEQMYRQLEEMANTLENVAGIVDKNQKENPEVNEKSVAPEPDSAAVVEEHQIPPVTQEVVETVHWHMPNTDKKHLDQLMSTLEIMEILPEYNDKDYLVFTATAAQLNRLFGGLEFSGVSGQNMPRFTQAQVVSGLNVTVSIRLLNDESFYDGMPSTITKMNGVYKSMETFSSVSHSVLDWHLLVMPSEMDKVSDVLRKNAKDVLYEKGHNVIILVLADQYRRLIDTVRGLGGVYADFSQEDIEEIVRRGGTVKIMIYFKKQ